MLFSYDLTWWRIHRRLPVKSSSYFYHIERRQSNFAPAEQGQKDKDGFNI